MIWAAHFLCETGYIFENTFVSSTHTLYKLQYPELLKFKDKTGVHQVQHTNLKIHLHRKFLKSEMVKLFCTILWINQARCCLKTKQPTTNQSLPHFFKGTISRWRLCAKEMLQQANLKYQLNSAKCASVCLQRLIHSSWCRRRRRFLCCNRNWSVWGLQSQAQQSTDSKLNEDPHPHHPPSEQPALRQIKYFSFWSTYFPNKLNGVNLETPQLWAVMENRADILSTSDITEKEHKGVNILQEYQSSSTSYIKNSPSSTLPHP